MAKILGYIFLLTALNWATADVIVFQSGKVIVGSIIQQDASGALIQMDYGTCRYPLSMIKDIKKEAARFSSESETQRIPNWGKIISALAAKEWAHELKQIPATVIDNGILKDVPYISFRCNTGGYEINIYGDLDHPAGVEIGAVNYLAKSDEAKTNCINFIASVMTCDDDKNSVRILPLQGKQIEKHNDMTFETTLTNEPDAYGGWWVSVYNETNLAMARASGAELLAITQPRVEPKWQAAPQLVAAPAVEATTWTTSDLSYARSSDSYSSSGGRVYVRGYTRANGTYVQPYTRSYPHHR